MLVLFPENIYLSVNIVKQIAIYIYSLSPGLWKYMKDPILNPLEQFAKM